MTPNLFSIAKGVTASMFQGLFPSSYWSRERTFVSLSAAGDFNKVVNPHNWHTMLATSRLLYASNPNLAGAIHEKGRLAVGNAWEPSYEGENQKWGDQATAFLKAARSFGNMRGEMFDFHTDLKIASYALDRDCDILMVLTEDENKFPKRQFFPAHRVGNGRFGAGGIVKSDRPQDKAFNGYRICLGVIYNEFRPVAVNVIGDTPDGDRIIALRDCMLLSNPRFADQGRGLPSLASGLGYWHDIGDIQKFETIAVKNASSETMVEYNDSGSADTGQQWINNGDSVTTNASGQPSNTVIEEKMGGLIRYYRAGSGSKIEFPMSNRPSPAWVGFMEHLERGGYEALDWPYDFVRATQAGGPTRLVSARAEKSVIERQGTLLKLVTRHDTYAIAKGVKEGYLPPAPKDWMNWSYTLPSSVTTDAGHDADKDREDFAKLLSSGRRIYAKRGEKWETETKQIIWETGKFLEWCKEAGVDPEEVRKRGQQGGSPPAPQPGQKPNQPPGK